MSKWNRRQFLSGLLAAAGAGATSSTYAEALAAGDPLGALPEAFDPAPAQPAAVSSAAPSAAATARPAVARDGDAHALRELLPEGMRFGRWRVVAVHPVKLGAVPVVLEGPHGRRFQVDVLRRDRHPQARRGVAETRHYALFLVNNGRGNTPTAEEEGLGLLWLAALLRPREHRVRPAQLLTQRERVRMHPRGRFDVIAERVTTEPPAPRPAAAPEPPAQRPA